MTVFIDLDGLDGARREAPGERFLYASTVLSIAISFCAIATRW